MNARLVACLLGVYSVACGNGDAPGSTSAGGRTSVAGTSGAATIPGGMSGTGASGAGSSSGGTHEAGGTMQDVTAGAGGATDEPIGVLVFSRTEGFRHDAIPAGVEALRALAARRGWRLVATEDPSAFSDAELEAFHVIVFLCTTGNVLDEGQQGAMERFVRAGHGFVGVHSASDTEYEWPWYGELVGAYFDSHPAVQSASILVESSTHPATANLPSPWTRTDEWYAFRTNPRERVHVLLRLDESSYSSGEASMGADHPIAWWHEVDGGRAFYTGLGHTPASYSEPEMRAHLAGAIEWAAGR